jgi:hypothetical protein
MFFSQKLCELREELGFRKGLYRAAQPGFPILNSMLLVT